ncbi:hypothetical protein DWY95_13020 [Faecalibacterium sp. AF28-13AC]|nr:hypothetical protein DWY95_13020 [Faecalibacterium sp. AF28-13AC]
MDDPLSIPSQSRFACQLPQKGEPLACRAGLHVVAFGSYAAEPCPHGQHLPALCRKAHGLSEGWPEQPAGPEPARQRLSLWESWREAPERVILFIVLTIIKESARLSIKKGRLRAEVM